MRIAMVVPPWYEVPPRGYGGLEVIAGALVDGLVARGHDVTLFGAGTRTGTAARFVSTHPETQWERLGELMPAIVHTAKVNKLIAEGGFDVVHDHSTDGPGTAPARPVPTVVTVHGPVVGELAEFLTALGASIRMVAISRSQRAIRPDLNWVATVHNALPLGAAHGGHGAHNGPVLWLARFTPDKGPDLAIRACREAGLPLVLAGKCNEPGEKRYLEQVIKPMLGDDVRLMVNADRASTQRVLAQARCLIMPIRWEEPFGMVMIEAMAVGTPVVGLAHGALPELVRDGLTGWICHDPDELPDALHKAHELDPAASVAHVQANFSAPLMARRYERVYLEAVDETRQPYRDRRISRSRPQPVPVLRRPAPREANIRVRP